MNAQLELAKLAIEALDAEGRAELLKFIAPTETEKPKSFRLYRMNEAAELTGVSRITLWRACNEGRLHSVEIRRGSRRIPEDALRAFVEGARK